MKSLKFSKNQRVNYILVDKPMFTGTIIKAEIVRGKKPYTILGDDGKTYFANEAFLKLL